MSVDYSLLPHFHASRIRQRQTLRPAREKQHPQPRPEQDLVDELRADVHARARQQLEELARASGSGLAVFLDDR